MLPTDPVLTFAGVVLAAGKSSRMGNDKALLGVEGQTLWRRQYALLMRVGVREPCYLSVRSDQTWVPSEFKRIEDEIPSGGPLGGIVSALSVCPCSHLLVLAVDLPRMDARWFEKLCASCDASVGAIGQRADETFEPLAAVYPRTLYSLADAELKAGRRSLQFLAKRAIEEKILRAQAISEDQTSWFENWNTPEDVKSRSS